MLCLCGNAVAETESLPPINDNSSYYDGNGTLSGAGSANGGSVNSVNMNAAASNSMYQIMGQLEQLQKELRQLSGTMEEQAHDIAEIKKRQTTMYDDIDQRLQALENAKGTAAAAAVPVADAAAPATPTTESVPPVTEVAPPVPTPEPAPPPSIPVTSLTPPPATPESGANYPKEIYSEVKDAKPVAPQPKTPEKEQYQAAYDTLRDGHYTRAIEAFKTQLVTYPSGDYAANAQYWLGEAYKVTQNFNASREAFNKVISNYPTSPKVPDALLKLGYLELEQDNAAKGKEYLSRVSSGYPNTTAAHLAAKKLSALTGMPQ